MNAYDWPRCFFMCFRGESPVGLSYADESYKGLIWGIMLCPGGAGDAVGGIRKPDLRVVRTLRVDG